MGCGTLPLVLVDALGAGALPAMAGICWCIFGIEEIGHLIEQPFHARGFGCEGEDGGMRVASWCCGVPVDSLAQGVSDAVWQLVEAAPLYHETKEGGWVG